MPIKADESKNSYKTFIHYSLSAPTKDLLKLLNIGCVSLANNHVFDCKMPGLKATVRTLDELGVFHAGAGWLPEHVSPVIISEDNYRIAFLAYVDKSTNPETEHFPELLINYFDKEKVISDIRTIRDQVDTVIVSIHWGNDYSNFYTKKQQESARMIIHSGADIIMGHHPHTLQPYEIYDGKLIFYSLGQLCFGDSLWEGKLRALKKKTKTGMIASVSIKKGSFRPHFIPTFEEEGNYLSILPLDLESKLNRLKFINEKIHKYKTIAFIARIKETALDRFNDYFFGYYRNFFVQLLGLLINIKKFNYLVRDYKNYKKD